MIKKKQEYGCFVPFRCFKGEIPGNYVNKAHDGHWPNWRHQLPKRLWVVWQYNARSYRSSRGWFSKTIHAVNKGRGLLKEIRWNFEVGYKKKHWSIWIKFRWEVKNINSLNYALNAQSSTLTFFLFCGKPKYLLIPFLRKLEIEPQL